MKLQEWLNDVDDRFIEVGGSANALNQCTDCANDFINRVLGKEMIFGTNAVDFWARADDSYERVAPSSPPIAEDIIIWNTNVGSAGHIAVATGIMNGSKFQTMSQNWPLKSPCHFQDYTTNNVIGYLRIKGVTMPDTCPTDLLACQKNYDALLAKELKWKALAGDLQVQLDACKAAPTTCPASADDLTKAIRKLV